MADFIPSENEENAQLPDESETKNPDTQQDDNNHTYEEDIDAYDDNERDLQKDPAIDSDDSERPCVEHELQADKADKNESVFTKIRVSIANKLYAFSKLDKKKRNKYIVLYGLIFVLVILVLTDLIPILPNSYNRSYVGNQYTLGETRRAKAVPYRKSVLYASEGAVMCFGPDMELISRVDTFSGEPFVRVSGDGAIVYAQNGSGALVMSGEKNHNLISCAEPIISASVNGDSDYVLVTKEAGYTACVSAFDHDNSLLYKWHTGSNILDTALSPSAEQIVASVIEYSDTSLCSKLVFLDTSKTEPVAEIVLDANLITEVFFADSNTVVAIGDAYTVAYSPDGHQKWYIDYQGKLLKTYDISDEGNIALLFNRFNSSLSESYVEIYNSRGRKQGSYKSDKNAETISVNNDYCLLTLDDSTALINKKGKLKKYKEHSDEYTSFTLFDNYNFAFALVDSVSETVSVRH